jgi:hypothetical protein
MPSDVEIANLALSQLGDLPILNFTDNNKRARELNRIYEPTRDSEIRAHIWNFAVRRIRLPALSTAPPFGFDFAYELPADYLRVIQAGDWPPGMRMGWWWLDGSEYRIEGRTIVTDYSAPLSLRYLARVTDPTQFDACFVTSFACELAIKLCETLTQSTSKKQEAKDDKKRAISDAIRSNAIELPPEMLPPNSWEMSRWPG